MPAPASIQQLVERFEQHRDTYRAGKYNETQLRREFLDPFFEALGWDVLNRLGYSEDNKHVIHEDSLEVEGVKKAPDYAFKVGRERKFFVEAKKPSVRIETNPEFAFQLRRYVWSAKLPLGILTDFEEFAVYECRSKPTPADKVRTGRVMLLKYTDYVEKWDEIASVFSYEAVMQGKFDAFANTAAKKKGTAEVDDAFLAEIEGWRETLAKNVALRNRARVENEADLNFAVQMIIDRVIFLRICEDRGFEPENQLQDLSNPPRSPHFGEQKWGEETVYGRLLKLFERADRRYNSGLFHFKEEKGRGSADTFTPHLEVDDKVLKEIIRDLYYPAPYVFSQIPADILGQIYEQFLGKVIRLTAGHQAKVEEKPEVRKAGGVYYTPTYIVDYIVKSTVGKLVNRELGIGKSDVTPADVAKVKIVDPACGSGTFLLGAYQFLLDWHLKWYTEHEPEKWAKGKNAAIFKTPSAFGTSPISELRNGGGQGGGWKLTIAKKKEILLNNLFGVDIDAQAVEVTKLSLLFKVIEDPGQLSMLDERILPDLGRNIQCGNSLIGSDYWEGQLFVDDEERARVNAFDWKAAFPEVFAQGGFDVVIGNPPYIFTRELLSEQERKYYSSHYKLGWEKQNTFMLFMELMLDLLSKKGRGGFIVPNSWLTIESAKNLRPALIPKLELIADLNYRVFKKVSMEPCIFVLSGQDVQSSVAVLRARTKIEFDQSIIIEMDRALWKATNNRIVFSAEINSNIIDTIERRSQMVGDVFDVRTGLQAYEKGKGTPRQTAVDVKNHVFDRDMREDENSFKYLQGKDVERYGLSWSGMWMQYGIWLSQPREFDIFSRPRVLVREITSEFPRCINATIVTGDFLNNKSILNVLHPNNDEGELKLLVAILNSRLISLYYKSRAVKSERKIFPKIVIKNLREFPYPKEMNKDIKGRIIPLIERMLALHKSLASARTPSEKDRLAREVESTDKGIDSLVYELYGLTEEEIGIVEG